MGFAAIYLLPFGAADVPSMLNIGVLGALIAVAVLSTVVPYVFDQLILPLIPAGTYSLLTALSPATSLVVGVIMLAQIPGPGEIAGLAAISLAVVLATGTTPTAAGDGTPSATPIAVVPVSIPTRRARLTRAVFRRRAKSHRAVLATQG